MHVHYVTCMHEGSSISANIFKINAKIIIQTFVVVPEWDDEYLRRLILRQISLKGQRVFITRHIV